MNGSVTPEGNTTSCSFQYGTTTSYGTTVSCAASAGNGESPVAESINVTGLTANTTYHYQLTASNVTGSSNLGGDQTFTTSASVSPPTNTVAPVVSGTATDKNGTLTTDNGTFTGTGLTYTYQWQRCSDTSTSCSTGTFSNISGATSSSYTPQDADTSFALDVVVTATNSAGSASGTSAATANVASIMPSNSTAPAISGTTTDGQTLTTTPGSWTGSSSFTYTYQWQQCSSSSLTCSGGTWSNITGATNSSYVAQDTDVNQPIRVAVTATGTTVAAGSTTADSSGVGPIAPGTPTNTVAPVISGTPTDGQTLSTTNGTWTGDQGFTYKYQWQRCSNASTSCSTGSWSNISGATNPTYKLQDADAGLSVQAVVTATGNKSGTSVSADSASVAVASNVPANTVAPTISGTTTDGQSLTATTGTWTGSGITYTYQWQRCSNTSTSCSTGTFQNISGATGNIHSLQDADTGFDIDIVVTATNSSGATSATSSATATVASTTPVNSVAPTISGTPTDGQILSASTGAWTGSSSFTYTYQWQRCSIATSTCTGGTWNNIAGATNSSYTLQDADTGFGLRVAVSATGTTSGAGTTTATASLLNTVASTTPVNTALPAISGTTSVGSVLSATPGSWTGSSSFTYTYQWQRCSNTSPTCSGGTFNNISGATSSSYTLQAADGGTTVQVVVTATGTSSGAGNTSATSLATATIASAPVNTAAPVLSTNLPVQGTAVSVSTGTWSGSPTFTYSWKDCPTATSSPSSCTTINGATSSSYTPVSGDLNDYLLAQVTATNGVGSSSASVVASSQTGTLPTVTTTAVTSLTISGATVNGTLNANGFASTYQFDYGQTTSYGSSTTSINGPGSSTTVPESANLSSLSPNTDYYARIEATNAYGTSYGSAQLFTTLPASTAAPVISGTATVGATLSTTNGTWAAGNTTSTTSYSYQWQRCATGTCTSGTWSNITGATSSSYTLQAADTGDTIQVIVTATNGGGSTPAASAPTSAISSPPVNTSLPTVSGTTTDGQTLSTTNGSWSGTPTPTFTYQWERCSNTSTTCSGGTWNAIAGATSSTYIAQDADTSFALNVVVTATNSAGSASATSSATAPLASVAPVNTTAPTISGATTDGQTLSVSTGSWTGSSSFTYSYQWARCSNSSSTCAGGSWQNISGATNSSYTLHDADTGVAVRASVSATGTTAASGTTTASSAASALITSLAPTNSGAPVVSGTTTDGQTLSTTNGSWTGSSSFTYTYQWERCSNTSAACSSGSWSLISGATSSSYVLQDADTGFAVAVVVTATDSTGSASLTSAATANVASITPANAVPPAISGQVVVGSVLTATTGSWTGSSSFTYSYQWERCSNTTTTCAGGTWGNISGATSSTYTLQGSDAGFADRVAVAATGITSTAGATTAASSPTSLVLTPSAPTSPTPPTISTSSPSYNTAISSSVGTGSTGAPSPTYVYEWQDCSSSSPSSCSYSQTSYNPLSPSFTPSSSDVGYFLRAAAYAMNSSGSSSTVFSAVSANYVTGIAPSTPSTPTLTSSTPSYDTSLSSSAGSGSTGVPSPSYSYQWQDCSTTATNSCSNSTTPGSTAQAFTPGGADIGSYLRVAVTATSAQGAWASPSSPTYSAETALQVVTSDAPLNTALPVEAGVPSVGQTLSTTDGTWTGTPSPTLTYQWERCSNTSPTCSGGTWNAITGAIANTYTLQVADIGYAIQAVITGTNSNGAASVASNISPIISGTAPTTPSTPTLSTNNPSYNTALSSSAGAGSTGSPNSVTYSYQWQDCSTTSTSSCINSSNSSSNAQAFTPQSRDIGAYLRVGVTATISQGAWSSTSSTSYSSETPNYVRGVGPGALSSVSLSGNFGSAPGYGSQVTAFGGTSSSGAVPSLITYSYQWQYCSESVPGVCTNTWANVTDGSGATSSSYTVGAAEVGYELRVLVTANNSQGNFVGSSNATSPATASVIGAPPGTPSTPTLSSNTPVVGQPLSSSAGAGSSNGIPAATSYSYQWYACTVSGNCDALGGATSQSFTPTAADQGDYLQVGVRATNSQGGYNGSSNATTVETTGAVEGPPVNVVAPALSTDNPAAGLALSTTNGTWSGYPAPTFTYQWEDCSSAQSCTPIAGATQQTYTPTNADTGSQLEAVVSATNAQGQVSASSELSNSSPSNTVPPALSTDSPANGVPLSVSNGTWTGSPAPTFTYQWEDCSSAQSCTPIAGAVSQTYTPARADIGSQLEAVVTATNSDNSVAANSEQSGAVTQPPLNILPPTIAGQRVDGQTLSVINGTWQGTGLTFTYQWQRLTSSISTCNPTGATWHDIPAALSTSYILQDADTGCNIRVTVTATASTGATISLNTLPTSPIVSVPVQTTAPVLSGTPTVGDTLSATSGSWTGSSSFTYAYQWQRDSSSPTTCDTTGTLAWQNITGATSSTYTLQKADIGCSVKAAITTTGTNGSQLVTTAVQYQGVGSEPLGEVESNIAVGHDNNLWSVTAGPSTYQISAITPSGVVTNYDTGISETNDELLAPSSMASAPNGDLWFTIDGDNSGAHIGYITPTGSVTMLPFTSLADNNGFFLIPSLTSNLVIGPDGDPWFIEDPPTLSGSIDGHGTAIDTVASDGTVTKYSLPDVCAPVDGVQSTADPYVSDITPGLDGALWFTYQNICTNGDLQWQVGSGVGKITTSGTITEYNVPNPDTATLDDIVYGPDGDLWFINDNEDIDEMTPSGILVATHAIGGAILGNTLSIGPDGKLWFEKEDSTIGSFSMTTGVQADYSIGGFNNAADSVGQLFSPTAGPNGALWLVSTSLFSNIYTVDIFTVGANPPPVPAVADTSATPAITSPPVNTAPPALSTDNPIAGQPVSVSNGTWTGYLPPTFTYQWENCTISGCSAIPGATSQSYTPTASDVGLQLEAVVTGTNSAGQASASSEESNAVRQAPINVTAPVLSTDTPDENAALTVSSGTWTGLPTPTLAYQWEECDSSGQNCTAINGATTPSYTPGPSDVGLELKGVVTATNSAGQATASSELSAPVLGPPASLSPPVVTGAPVDGDTLTTTTGSFSSSQLTYTYQWQESQDGGISWQNVPGATSTTYPLRDADVGDILRSQVTATNPVGSAVGTSAPTAPIAEAPNITGPRLSTDFPVYGQTLSVSNGTFGGSPSPTITYQWVQCDPAGDNCTTIAGATQQSYTPTTNDIGQTLQAIVTATNNISTSSAASEVSNPVLGPPVNVLPPAETTGSTGGGQPSILIPQPTKALSSQPGTWTNNPTSYSYQWEDCDANGDNCSPIAGATEVTYSPTMAELGDTLVLEVVATNAAGTGTAYSPPTNAISEAPVNKIPPALSTDNPVVGSVVTVSNGTWAASPAPTFAYQWLSCDPTGTSCTPIIGAVAQTYTPTATEIGHRLEAAVTATNDVGSATAYSEVSNPIPGPNGTTAPSTPPTTTTPPGSSTPPPTLIVTPPCTIHAIVLTGVYREGNRVRLYGVAGSALDGEKLDILFGSSRRVVATTTVGSDGLFFAWAPLPRRAVRSTNTARYRAVVGMYASMFLKLSRRTIVGGATVSGDSVIFAGHLVTPVKAHTTIQLSAQTNCGSFVPVAHTVVGPRRHFTMTVPTPAAGVVTIYRLSAQVPANKHSAKLFGTFSLPIAINLAAKEYGVR